MMEDTLSSLIGFLTFLVVISLVIFALVKNDRESKKRRQEKVNRLQKAQLYYQRSLTRLKSQPDNADLKQKTLELGRVYAHLTRSFNAEDGTVTIFDEIALLNDINAACAGAAPAVTRSAIKERDSVEARLARLSELKDKGLITDAELSGRRQKILDEI